MLLLVVHHIVADASSIDLILNELPVIYQAFSSWNALSVAGTGHSVRGFCPVAERPSLRRPDQTAIDVLEEVKWRARRRSWSCRSIGLGGRGRRQRVLLAAAVISKALTTRLKSLGQSEGASLFMVLLTAFQVLLYRCSGQSDVVVGAAISGRKFAELEKVVGLFVNTLPLRIDLSGNPSFRQRAFAGPRDGPGGA